MWAAVWHNGFDPQIMAQGAIVGDHSRDDAYRMDSSSAMLGSGFVEAPQEVSTR